MLTNQEVSRTFETKLSNIHTIITGQNSSKNINPFVNRKYMPFDNQVRCYPLELELMLPAFAVLMSIDIS